MKKCMTWLMAALCSVAVAAPAMAADTIKIGVQGAHSGDLASYGVPSLNAAKIVIEEANAKGGVLGKRSNWCPRTTSVSPNWPPTPRPS